MLDSCKNKIKELIEKRKDVETAKDILTNLRESSLRFASMLLYDLLGIDMSQDLIELLIEIDGSTVSQLNASYLLSIYTDYNVLPPECKKEAVIIQQAIRWCGNQDQTVRWLAVRILFNLLSNPDNTNVIVNQLIKLMDSDNLYIKKKILDSAHLLKQLNPDSFSYIIKKASVDKNYIVRQAASKLIIDMNIEK